MTIEQQQTEPEVTDPGTSQGDSAVETPASDNNDDNLGEGEGGEPSTDTENKRKEQEKKRHDQRRWEKVLKERAEYKAKADFYEQEVRTRATLPAPQEGGRPKRDQFETVEEYLDALTDYNEALAVEIPKIAKREAESVTVQAKSRSADREFIKSHHDFDDVIEDAPQIALQGAAVDAVVDSDINAELRYYLASNPEEYEKIGEVCKTNPIRAAKMIGAIESKLLSKQNPPPKVPYVPEPRKPGGGRASVERDPEKMTMKEFAAWDAEQQKKKRG